jgi:lysophospholipase L1-like esterase
MSFSLSGQRCRRTPANRWILDLCFLLCCCLPLFLWGFAQSPVEYKWWDPSKNDFPVIEGQGWTREIAHPYDRLPARAQPSVRQVVWNLSRQGAGLVIRFRSDATDIHVRYTVKGRMEMPHMPATGVSGIDLYAADKDGKWEWTAGKYSFGDTIRYNFSSLGREDIREYYLYLPLYNEVGWLEIGTPADAKMTPLPVRTNKPVVVYGTSIAQGACASRPGMAWTAILGRRLDRPVINLGFSGNGQLENGITQLLTELDAGVFVLDCLPNMSRFPADTVISRLMTTVRTLQQSRPGIPILLVDDADAGIRSLDSARNEVFDKVNRAGKVAYNKMIAAGMKDIWLLPAEDIGLDIESTVDGVHPNDVGMQRYAAAYEKIIRKLLARRRRL